MLKKILTYVVSLFLFCSITHAEDINLHAKSSILVEESTGKVIYENNADEQLHPASMTKIMSMILIFEAISDGKISLSDDVVVSKESANMGGSQVYLNEGETYKVEELLKAVSIASANDAVVALAEKVSGTKEKFVEKMNEKARMLKLKNTNFINPHGLDDNNHYSSARDMAIMAKELLKYENVLSYTSKYEDYFKKKDGSSIWLVNTNKLVKFYNGMDGLKTGYTEKAGYCLTSTAKKNGLRLIAVVMGEDSIENRTEDTLKLMNYGFNTIKKELIIDNNKVVDKLKIDLSSKKYIDVYLKNDIVKIYDINSSKIKYNYKIKYKDNIRVPLKKGSIIGKIKVDLDDGTSLSEDLIIKENINKIGFMKLFRKNLNIFSMGVN